MEDELNLDLSKTYIYEGEEYIMTGRVAERPADIPAASTTRRSRRRRPVDITPSEPEVDYMVEIKPAPKNRSIIVDASEVKWVRKRELYTVVSLLGNGEDD